MNSPLKLMLLSAIAASATAMTSTCESCYTYSAQMFGPIDLPSLNNPAPATESRNTTDEVARYELPSDVMAQLPGELAAMIASADKTPETYVDIADKSVRYYATYADEGCSSKSAVAFETWEESFGSLEDCCEEMFSWNVDACLRR